MNWDYLITTVCSMVSVLGGWEAVRYLINRKSNKRISESEADRKETEADSDEFHLLRETIEFLQTQLREKEERFAEQTRLLRQQNTEILDLTRQKAAIELELQTYKCVVKKCAHRQPQNGY